MALTTEARKPFYASVGAVDLAVEKTRELPGTLLTELPARTTELAGKAFALYADLVGRGEKLLGGIRRSPSPRNAVTKPKAATTGKAAKATAKPVQDGPDNG